MTDHSQTAEVAEIEAETKRLEPDRLALCRKLIERADSGEYSEDAVNMLQEAEASSALMADNIATLLRMIKSRAQAAGDGQLFSDMAEHLRGNWVRRESFDGWLTIKVGCNYCDAPLAATPNAEVKHTANCVLTRIDHIQSPPAGATMPTRTGVKDAIEQVWDDCVGANTVTDAVMALLKRAAP